MDTPSGAETRPTSDRPEGSTPPSDYPPPPNYPSSDRPDESMPPPPSNYPPPPSYPSGYGPGYPGGPGGPGGYGRPTPPGPPPDNNLVMAIISIFCCWPLAIPAIIFATQVQSKWAMGDFAGAKDSADKARTFSMIAIILGLALAALYVIFWLVFGFAFFNVWTTVNTTVR